jgi:hypothetical protein
MEFNNIIKKHLKLISEQSIQDNYAFYKTNKLQIDRILKSGGPIKSNSITKRFVPKPTQKNPNELLSLQTDNFFVVTNKNQPNNLKAMPKSEKEAIQLVNSYPGADSIPEEQKYIWVEQPLKGVFKAYLIYPLNLSKLNESNYETKNYMFFSNLQQIHRQSQMLMKMNPQELDQIIQNGHDWADDHISEAKNNMDQVFDFFMNKTKRKENVTPNMFSFGLNEEKQLVEKCWDGYKQIGSKKKMEK